LCNALIEHMSADSLTKGFGFYSVLGACDSFEVIRVFCSIKLVGVMCLTYIMHIFVLPFACICVNYGIDFVIRDIVCESQ
jgi:hypothetical protein